MFYKSFADLISKANGGLAIVFGAAEAVDVGGVAGAGAGGGWRRCGCF